MIILCDSREQKPYQFSKFEVGIEKVCLPCGDYSLPGFENKISLERKNIDDLIQCLSRERERFERELAKARHYETFAVIVEASMDDIAKHRYRSRMKPQAALQSIFAMWIRYGIPFVFAGNRDGAEYTTYSLLSKYYRELEIRFNQARRGQENKKQAA